jgi:tetratricopeptide (TPR) repeat protein
MAWSASRHAAARLLVACSLGAATLAPALADGLDPGETPDGWMPGPSATATEVSSGGRHRVQAARRRWSPDEGMAVAGAYAQAVALDANGQHVQALRAYAAATAALDGQIALVTEPCQAMWRARVAWQREVTERLLEQQSYVVVMPGALLAHFNLGLTLHQKFLAVRAFLGRGPRLLWSEALAQYRAALELDPHHAPTHLALAALYAEAGLRDEAARTAAAAGRRRNTNDSAPYLAMYLAAMGDRDGALAALATGLPGIETRRWALRGNAFDTLRNDPRWAELFPGRDDAALLHACRR